jgi:hypothetical protein
MLSRRGLLSAGGLTVAVRGRAANGGDKPALLGGNPAHPGPFPPWPVYDDREQRALAETLVSRKWNRISGQNVNRFEQAFARVVGTKGCVATTNGTLALYLSLRAL